MHLLDCENALLVYREGTRVIFNALFPKVSPRVCAVCGGHGHVGCACVVCCQWSCRPEVPVRAMWPLYTAWLNFWVETEDTSRKMKLKLSLIEASVGAAPNCNASLLCSCHGAWCLGW